MSGDKNWAVTDTDSSGLFMSVAGFNSTGTIDNPPGVIGLTATFKNRKQARAYGASRIEAGDIGRFKLVRLIPQRENESWIVAGTGFINAWVDPETLKAEATATAIVKTPRGDTAVFDSRAKARLFRDKRNRDSRNGGSPITYKVIKYVA